MMLLRCCCGVQDIAISPPVWSIKQEVLPPHELGAGWVFKRAKNKAIWNKRFFVLTNTNIEYYTEADRSVLKGSITIAGSVAQVSMSRESSPDKKYFSIIHPECGFREFYTTTLIQRSQWIEAINNVSRSLKTNSIYGYLKRFGGGTSKLEWQDRWCICVGHTFEYFLLASDNIAKGSLELYGSRLKRLSHPGFENCFEIAIKSGEGRFKQYVFGAETDASCGRWIEVLSAIINATPPMSSHSPKVAIPSSSTLISGSVQPQAQRTDSVESTVEEETMNPLVILPPKSTGVLDSALGSAVAISSGKTMSGYLLKESPVDGRGFQKRYFVLRAPGVLVYFMKVIIYIYIYIYIYDVYIYTCNFH